MLLYPKIYIKLNGNEHLFDNAPDAIRFVNSVIYDGGDFEVGVTDGCTLDAISVFSTDCEVEDLIRMYSNRL